MKKILSVFLALLAVMSLMAGASAADDSRQYDFILSCDGKNKLKTEKDSVVTVTLSLRCADSEAAEVSAFQTELCYDDEFLAYVGSSAKLPQGVEAVDLCTDDYGRRLRISYAVPGPSELFGQETEIMSFDFKVLKEEGTSRLVQEQYLVSNEDGTDIYDSSAEDFTVVAETYIVPEYSVFFEAMNGEAFEEVLITEGASVNEPETLPIRDGYNFSGWYSDSSYTQLYDFAQPVENDITLYAKWEKEASPVSPWILYALAAPVLIGLIVFLILRKKNKEKGY